MAKGLPPEMNTLEEWSGVISVGYRWQSPYSLIACDILNERSTHFACRGKLTEVFLFVKHHHHLLHHLSCVSHTQTSLCFLGTARPKAFLLLGHK